MSFVLLQQKANSAICMYPRAELGLKRGRQPTLYLVHSTSGYIFRLYAFAEEFLSQPLASSSFSS